MSKYIPNFFQFAKFFFSYLFTKKKQLVYNLTHLLVKYKTTLFSQTHLINTKLELTLTVLLPPFLLVHRIFTATCSYSYGMQKAHERKYLALKSEVSITDFPFSTVTSLGMKNELHWPQQNLFECGVSLNKGIGFLMKFSSKLKCLKFFQKSYYLVLKANLALIF